MRCLIKGAEKLQEEKELTSRTGHHFCYRNWEIEFRMKT
jgi:hypothetical protein